MVSFSDNEFSDLGLYITNEQPSQVFVLVDKNTRKFCLPLLQKKLNTKIPTEIIEIKAGEKEKNIVNVTRLWETLAKKNADRKSLLINLGGGVISDLGGFIASTYKRGIPFINIPTTLLSMCDAAIGGKTGIDHDFYKNIIGTFSLAEKTYIYPKFLETLPFAELRSGFAEMLKHGLVADASHWKDLTRIKNLEWQNIEPLIKTSVKIKERIVDADPREENVRKKLNFGHTIGHAVESLFLKRKNPIPHGEAVAMGMIAETHLSYLENLISKEQEEDILTKIIFFYPKINIEIFKDIEIYNVMLNDKKNTRRKINFSLIKNVGNCIYNQPASKSNVIESIKFYISL
ncbi:MAG: 3-dehydroquinate synthase [Bergeyella sp.]|nr:3-dehydroquinate synthase [Bergeyella sp.]